MPSWKEQQEAKKAAAAAAVGAAASPAEPAASSSTPSWKDRAASKTPASGGASSSPRPGFGAATSSASSAGAKSSGVASWGVKKAVGGVGGGGGDSGAAAATAAARAREDAAAAAEKARLEAEAEVAAAAERARAEAEAAAASAAEAEAAAAAAEVARFAAEAAARLAAEEEARGARRYTLTTEHAVLFARNGFVVVKGLLRVEELRRLAVGGAAPGGVMASGFDLDDTLGRPSRGAVFQAPGDDALGRAARLKKVKGTVGELLGGTVAHVTTKVFVRQPFSAGTFVWHQDYGYDYERFPRPDMGSALLAIEGAPSPAHLSVIPGSHALGRISHVPLGGGLLGADPQRVADLVGAGSPAVRPAAQGGGRFALEELALEPGDAVFFHALLLRRFERNSTPTQRAFLLTSFTRWDNPPLRPAAPGGCGGAAPGEPGEPLPDDALLALDPDAPAPLGAAASSGFLFPVRYGADGTLAPVTERWQAAPAGGGGGAPPSPPPAVAAPRARLLAEANAPRGDARVGGVSGGDSEAPTLATFNPTAHDAIVEALALASLRPGDVLLDLGCGDGRVAIEAARSCDGVHAIGYDTNAAVLQRGLDRLSARAACGDPAEKDAAGRVSLLCGDASRAGTEGVTVVFVYLVPEGLERVKPLLAAVLERGGRVVSNMFKVPGWEHKTQRVARGCSIYLYGR